MYQRSIFTGFFICILFSLYAQSPGDLYLFALEKGSKGEYHVHSAKFLSSFNKGGYTNQPSFTNTGDILVSVRRQGENQNDIYQLSPALKKYKKLTKTKASEYSPRLHPDEEQLTVLRQLSENPIDQQVCNIPFKSGELLCVTPDMKDVAYYSWLTPSELGLYRLEGTGSKLSYYNAGDNKSRRITTSVGTTLVSDKAGYLVFVHKFTDEYWYIKKYKPSTSAVEIVTQTVSKNEDFALAADGTYFMGKDHVLYAYHPDQGKEWFQVADLSAYGIKYITRLAISQDSKKIAIVAEKQKS